MGKPSIYPTGVTIYDKDRTFNGYTLYNSAYGATLIDMNGRLVKVWNGLDAPMKPLPGGQLMASVGKVPGPPGAASKMKLVQVDWNGNVVWDYSNNQLVKENDGRETMASCHHHDFEKEGCAAGYYSPCCQPLTGDGNVLLLTHKRVWDLKISDKSLLDERIIEVDKDGETVWEWNAHEHIEELGLDEDARKALFAFPMLEGDWIHLNAVATLGQNVYYDHGDVRFAPDNIICSSRQLNTVFIIEKSTKKIVWRIGPDYMATPELADIGQVIGQHHAHMIPKGLPGEGHILIFDNGSFGGYGRPNGCAPKGTDVLRRHYSRVLEIDPATYEVVWEYMKAVRNEKDVNEMGAQQFFSPYISSAQRLPNGNTLIDEGADGQMIEVTPQKEIVWEFINPIRNTHMPLSQQFSVYRAYRLPYSWVPQLKVPKEHSIACVDVADFRVPGSCVLGSREAVETDVKIPVEWE
ncbi:MAG: aryl-sulfate sulfotransferase [Clostridiales bacterium]|nr:aryl-sulfate sulfotransferase [Clostridiales bacterium]